mgnify:CR=1 FL=1
MKVIQGIMNTHKIAVAVDGPAGAGKSSISKIVAKKLGYLYIDTGAMYRAATYIALKHQLDAGNVDQLLELLNQHPISFGRSETGEQLVFVGDVEITHPIRENEVTNKVSSIAAIPEVREKLVSLQQEIAQQGGIVMDGRDIGTVVLPQAELKIFLVASVEERAERRYKENIAKGIETDLETLKEEIEKLELQGLNSENSKYLEYKAKLGKVLEKQVKYRMLGLKCSPDKLNDEVINEMETEININEFNYIN